MFRTNQLYITPGNTLHSHFDLANQTSKRRIVPISYVTPATIPDIPGNISGNIPSDIPGDIPGDLLYFDWTEQTSKRQIVPVSYVIPATIRDGDCLKRLFKAIYKGSALPRQIVVSLSEAPDTAVISPWEALSIPAGVSVVIIARAGVHNQADNRNMGSKLASESLLSFFDADDYPHPKRLEILYEHMSNNPSIDGALHNYFYTPDGPSFQDLAVQLDAEAVDSQATVYSSAYLQELYITKRKERPGEVLPCCFVAGETRPSVHNAMLTIRRKLFKEFMYSTDPKYYRMEDSKLIADLFENNRHISTLRAKLAIYDEGGGRCRSA